MVSRCGPSNNPVTVNAKLKFILHSSGPLSSVLTNRFGFQLVVMTGGLLIFAGVIATTFTTSVNQIYLTYGLITGTKMRVITLSIILTFIQFLAC